MGNFTIRYLDQTKPLPRIDRSTSATRMLTRIAVVATVLAFVAGVGWFIATANPNDPLSFFHASLRQSGA